MEAGMGALIKLSDQLLYQLNAYEAAIEQIGILNRYLDTCSSSPTSSSPSQLPSQYLRSSLGEGVRRMYDKYRLQLGRRARKTHNGLLHVGERRGIELHVPPVLDHPGVQRPLTNREDNSVLHWLESDGLTYREG